MRTENNILVFAGSRRQFEDFLRRNVIFDDRIDKIHGVQFDQIITIGTWHENSEFVELFNIAQELLRSKQGGNL